MRLTFDDPARPQDLFVINDRTDGDPLVRQGETFEVDDTTGRNLLSLYHPRLKVTPEQAGSKDNPIVVAFVPAIDKQADVSADSADDE